MRLATRIHSKPSSDANTVPTKPESKPIAWKKSWIAPCIPHGVQNPLRQTGSEEVRQRRASPTHRAHRERHCRAAVRQGIDKLPGILERSQQMIVEFLVVVQAAHLSFLPAEQLDSLAVSTYRGQQRLAGVDIQKPRLRAVAHDRHQCYHVFS